MKLGIGDPAPAGVVIDSDGQPVELNRLWADGPIFLTFLRHFG
jgi:hypothetical protein